MPAMTRLRIPPTGTSLRSSKPFSKLVPDNLTARIPVTSVFPQDSKIIKLDSLDVNRVRDTALSFTVVAVSGLDDASAATTRRCSYSLHLIHLQEDRNGIFATLARRQNPWWL